jgi:hypothetical protein
MVKLEVWFLISLMEVYRSCNANDTILFMEHVLKKTKNMKLILSAFEQLLRLKINFHKSELFYFGEAQGETQAYAKFFGCSQGQFPIR